MLSDISKTQIAGNALTNPLSRPRVEAPDIGLGLGWRQYTRQLSAPMPCVQGTETGGGSLPMIWPWPGQVRASVKQILSAQPAPHTGHKRWGREAVPATRPGAATVHQSPCNSPRWVARRS